MKILHVCYNNGGGGADIAASRIHQALLSENIDSNFLCCRTSQFLPNCFCIYGKVELFINKLKNQIVYNLLKLFKYQYDAINIFPSGIYKIINKYNADIVHLHYVCAEMMSIEEIAKIKKPIVWTMPDLWACLGSNSYSHTRAFPMIENYPYTYTPHKYLPDIDYWCWKRKNRAWKRLFINPVAVSDWMKYFLQESLIFKEHKIVKINYCLDTSIFNIQPKQLYRTKWGLPDNKFIILAGGSGNKISRKGFDLLVIALNEIKFNNYFELAIFGEITGKGDIGGLRTHWLGKINNNDDLSEIFNSVNLMCAPSRQESFGQTAAEALACGTPVVAFRATGLIDIVDHKENGYLAEPYNPSDFATGIKWIINLYETEKINIKNNTVFEDKLNYSLLCINAREKAEKSFAFRKVAQQYIELYKDLLAKK